MKKPRDNQEQQMPPQEEQGSAILLTLGILSMVLIMGMSFSFSSISSRRIASINGDQTRARLLVKSALNRAMRILYSASEDTANQIFITGNSGISDDVNFSDSSLQDTTTSSSDWKSSAEQPLWVSKNTAADATETDELEELLDINTTGAASATAAHPILRFIRELPTNSGFIPIYENGDNTKPVIGRIGYLILDDSNKLNVNAVLDPRGTVMAKEEISLVTDADGNLLTPGDSKPAEYFQYQKNQNNYLMSQIAISNYWSDCLLTGNSTLDTKMPWTSFIHMKRASDAKSSTNGIFYYPAIHSFYSGIQTETYPSNAPSDEQKDRFDLSGFSWCSDKAHYNDTAASTQKTGWWSSAEAGNLLGGDREDLLSAVGDGGFPFGAGITTDSQKRQILANMVDYCDPDYHATIGSDNSNDPSNFTVTKIMNGTASPTYCGNEKVPYINEIKLTISKDAKKVFLQKIEIELQNLYKLAETYMCKCKIKFKYYNSSIYTTEITKPSLWENEGTEREITVEKNIISNNTDMFITNNDNTLLEDTAYKIADVDQENTCHLQIESLHVILFESDNKIYDISIPVDAKNDEDNFKNKFIQSNLPRLYDENAPKENNYAILPQGLTVGNSVIFDTEVSDSRCNLNQTQWTSYFDKRILGSIGTTNTAFSDSTHGYASVTDKDSETYTSTESPYSTAFIRNAPFQSIWELGCIHKGKKFQTISLMKSTDPDVDIDKLKVGPIDEKYVFNPNTKNVPAWNALLAGMKNGDNYDNTTDSGTEYTVTQDALNAISPFQGRTGYRELCEQIMYATDSNYTSNWNKRQQESLFGRTCGLVGTDEQCFTILVVGQALEHLEGLDGLTGDDWTNAKASLLNPTTFRSKKYSILATQRAMAQVVFNHNTKQFRIVRLVYLDEE